MVSHAFAQARSVLSGFRRLVVENASGVQLDGIPAPGEASARRRKDGQELDVRLPDVWPVRLVVDRHVLPDELPEIDS